MFDGWHCSLEGIKYERAIMGLILTSNILYKSQAIHDPPNSAQHFCPHLTLSPKWICPNKCAQWRYITDAGCLPL
jgi:hypothetical protein